jgi:GNAT superfamily N-acetyltransferase
MSVSMRADITIRQASGEDADSLAILSEQLGYPTSPEEILTRFPRLHEMEDHSIFVAISKDKTILGWIHVFVSYRLVSEPYAELGGLVVADGHRSQGIGEDLLQAAEQWAKERGLAILRIRARSTRARAHRFYTRMGYRVWKEQKVFEKFLDKDESMEPGD